MGRGEKKRKRVFNALKAKAEKKNKPSILDNVKHKNATKKSKNNEEKLPASLKRFMALKAAVAEGPKPRGNKFKPTEQQAKKDQNSEPIFDDSKTEPASKPIGATEKANEPAQQPAPKEAKKKQKPAPTEQPIVKLTASGKPKTLRQDKKEFLKLKKQRKKNKGGSKNEMTELEEELADRAAHSKPVFGEQAHQPIQVNLKRRHWTDQEKSAAERCKEVFLKQMNTATHQSSTIIRGRGGSKASKDDEAARKQIINAYRHQKRQEGENTTATMDSLAALVRKDTS